MDRSAEGRIRVTGAERVAWLQGLLTNDVAALTPGTGCYAAWLTPQGRMVTDVRVLNRGNFFVLDLPAGQTAALMARLENFIITEDVTLEDVGAAFGRLGLHGPQAWRTLSAVIDLPPEAASLAPGADGLPEHTNLTASFRGDPLVLAGSRDLGWPGVDLYIAAAQVPALRDALLAAGAEEMDDEAWEARRIEAGRPRFGTDMTEDTIPLEAGLEHRAISFTKGCYVGQEIIIRVTHRGGGRVARRLVGLAPLAPAPIADSTLSDPIETTSAPADTAAAISAIDAASAATAPATAPAPVLAPVAASAVPAAGTPVSAGGKSIGQITSAAFSPRLGHWIALAYVHRDFVAPGTPVHVGAGAAPAAATGGRAAADAGAESGAARVDIAGIDAPRIEVREIDASVRELPFVHPVAG